VAARSRKYPWLKVWHEARNDAKLRSLTDQQFRVWFNLLCFASEQSERGTIRGMPHAHVAVEVSGGDQDLLLVVTDALQALRIVTWRYTDDGALEIVFRNFEKYQAVRDSERPERVKARVAKHRKSKASGSVTAGNERKRAVTGVTGLDVEGDVEEELIPPPPEGGIPHPRKPEDLADIQRAIDLLTHDLRTEAMALELGRSASLPSWLEVPGWKFLRAAERIVSPEVPDAKRRWAYFCGIVKGLTDADRQSPAAGSATSGPLPPSPAQRRRDEQQAKIRAAIERQNRERGEATDGDAATA
jgi:hypothetical protein